MEEWMVVDPLTVHPVISPLPDLRKKHIYLAYKEIFGVTELQEIKF
jgi:hypothetical protein